MDVLGAKVYTPTYCHVQENCNCMTQVHVVYLIRRTPWRSQTFSMEGVPHDPLPNFCAFKMTDLKNE